MPVPGLLISTNDPCHHEKERRRVVGPGVGGRERELSARRDLFSLLSGMKATEPRGTFSEALISRPRLLPSVR